MNVAAVAALVVTVMMREEEEGLSRLCSDTLGRFGGFQRALHQFQFLLDDVVWLNELACNFGVSIVLQSLEGEAAVI